MGQPTPSAPNPNSANNIWIACADGDLSTVKGMVESGQYAPNAQDENGYSPLHAAASYDHMALVDYLLGKDASLVHLVDEDGDTPLHAVESEVMARRLIEAGAVVDAKNSEDQTPLEVAFDDDRAEVVAYLMAQYEERGIALPESVLMEQAARDDPADLQYTLADSEEDGEEETRELDAAQQEAVGRIERALQRTDLEDGEAGDAELREAVAELVVAGVRKGAASASSSSSTEPPSSSSSLPPPRR
ncbi:ankyrin repeat-containing domain protein [Blastocladiella britannica]|nr:ankyrin repeat-containing domain protein [Blastocladiella britannica]